MITCQTNCLPLFTDHTGLWSAVKPPLLLCLHCQSGVGGGWITGLVNSLSHEGCIGIFENLNVNDHFCQYIWCIFCEIAMGWMSVFLSQHWFSEWLGVIRQQAITWTNVDTIYVDIHDITKPQWVWRNKNVCIICKNCTTLGSSLITPLCTEFFRVIFCFKAKTNLISLSFVNNAMVQIIRTFPHVGQITISPTCLIL